jgi:hypothetical protein
MQAEPGLTIPALFMPSEFPRMEFSGSLVSEKPACRRLCFRELRIPEARMAEKGSSR